MTDFATRDLVLAIAHHLLIFSFAAALAFQITVTRRAMTADDIVRLARVDIWYGLLAAAILAVGICRAVFAAKGWHYYSVNIFFQAKLGAFAIVGLLSIMPTRAIRRWRRALARDTAFLPPPDEIGRIRRILWLEVLFFAMIPAFAAAMARFQGF